MPTPNPLYDAHFTFSGLQLDDGRRGTATLDALQLDAELVDACGG